MKKKRQSEPCADIDNESTESCDDNQNKSSCNHAAKAVDLARIKKVLKTGLKEDCIDCAKVSVDDGTDGDFEYDLSLWLCLKCGNHACGRTRNKHALKHFETPHSDSHALCVNTTTWMVWCYDCNVDVVTDSRKKLLDAVEYIKKQMTHSPKNSPRIEIPDHEVIEIKAMDTKLTNYDLPRVRGLSNLGNTCFFNAVMQCLAQTPFLLSVLEELSEPGERFELPGGMFKSPDGTRELLPPIIGQLSKWGPLTETLADTLREMQSGCCDVFSPRALLSQLSHKLPQFGGGDQEDSHELLRHLLEAVRTEDLKRYQLVILNTLGYSNKTIPASVDDVTRHKLKFYGQQASDMMLRPEQVFRGVLVSTLQCQDCQHSSNREEYFLDLSLPVTAEKPQPPVLRRKSELDEETKPSKHQIKKERKMQRKGRKQKNNKSFENTGTTSPVDTNKTSNNSESEQSDADVEDNIEDGFKNSSPADDTSIVESGYNSDEKKDLPEKNEQDKEDIPIDIVSQNNTKNLSSSGVDILFMNTKDGKNVPLVEEAARPTSPVNGMQVKVEQHLIKHTEIHINEHEPLKNFGDHQRENVESNFKVSGGNVDSQGSPDDEGVKAVLDINELSLERKLDGSPELIRRDVIALGWRNDDELINDHVCIDDSSPELPIPEARPIDEIRHGLGTTIGLRYQCDEGECSVQSCLNQFTALELMTGNNKVCCEACTERINGKNGKSVYTNSTKQLLISSPPAILILHLKRFQVFRSLYRKMSKHVNFPLVLDLAPFCSNKCKDLPSIDNRQNKLLYSLYGVVEHSGTLHGGHYVAYVKVRRPLSKDDYRWQFLPSSGNKTISNRNDCTEEGAAGITEPEPPKGKWYHVSDSFVNEVSENKILKTQAYLLFYERIL